VSRLSVRVAAVGALLWLSLIAPRAQQLSNGQYRLYSRRKNPKTGRRRNLGTFRTRAAAERHERAVQFFKRRG
jgi:hypothetical protein